MFKLKPSGIYEQNLAQSYYELFKISKKYRQKKKKKANRLTFKKRKTLMLNF